MARLKKEDAQKRDKQLYDYYVKYGCTFEDVAIQFNMSTPNITRIATKDNWNKRRKEQYDTRKVKLNDRHYNSWANLLNILDDIIEHPDEYLKYENGTYKIGTLEKIANILEKIQVGQRLAIGIIEASEIKKLKLASEKLELEKRKINGDPIEQMEDDGFNKALNSTAEEVWGDEFGEEDKQGSI